ncbi:MAG: hypothetical protein SFX73_15985 [Kofleriaceae bacterium]|nr:hypothetical protein [Kofleriaceae bacterium]
MRLFEGAQAARIMIVVGVVATVTACHPAGPRTATSSQTERAIVSDLSISLEGKGVVVDRDGSSRLPGHGHASFKVSASSNLTRHPYPGEDLKAVLTTGERVVSQGSLVLDARRAKAVLDIPQPGTYRVEIWSGEKFLVGNTFVAASLPAHDGQRVLELHQDAAPRLYITRGFEHGRPTFAGHVRVMHWDSIDSDTGFIAEWWHDGKRVSAAGRGRSALQKQVLLDIQVARGSLDLTTWRWTTQKFELPDHLPTRAGHWELRVYREHHPAVAFGFDVTARGAIRGGAQTTIQEGSVELVVTAPELTKTEAKAVAKQIAQLPREAFEASKQYALGVTVAEVRALTRSEELRRLRLRINELQRSWPGGAPDTVTGEDTPQVAEMKRLVATMKKMIAAMGEPWAESERPASGRRG